MDTDIRLYDRDQLWELGANVNRNHPRVLASHLRLSPRVERLLVLAELKPDFRGRVVWLLEANGIDVGPYASGTDVRASYRALCLAAAEKVLADHDWAVQRMQEDHEAALATMAETRAYLAAKVIELGGPS